MAVRGPGAFLHVVSCNIEFGREIEGALDLFRETDALGHPDILLLQEMSSSGVVRMAAGLGMNYLYFPSGVHPQARLRITAPRGPPGSDRP